VKWIALMAALSTSLAAASPDPATYGPALVSEMVEGSSGCSAVEVAGDYLYAAGADYFAVFDITADPAKPKRIAELKGIKGSRQMAIYKDKAYITARNYGLWIVDIADPREPKLIRQFDTIELATGIAAAENVIFIAHRVYGVQLLDVTDPRFPRHISQVRTAEAQSVVYRDGMLYIGDWGVGKLTIADVRDLRHPKVVAQGTLDGFGDGVFLKDNLCFCSTGHDAKSGPTDARPGNGRGVEIFDISDPAKPKKLGVFKFPQFLPRDNDYWTSRVCGSTLFCVDSHNGFYMVDVSDPASMKGLGHLQLPPPVYKWKVPDDRKLSNDCCASLATGDGVVYIAGLTTGIHVVRAPAACRQPQPELRFEIPAAAPEAVDPRLQRYDLHCQVRRVAVKDDFVYVAASHAGLKLFGIGADGLKELRTWERECVYDVSVHGDTLFVAENNLDLAVYRIAADGDLTEIGRGQLDGNQSVQIVHPFMDARYLAVSCGTGRFSILDATDLTRMKPVYGGGAGGILYGDMFPVRDLDGVFPVNWHSRGIAWYDLNGPAPVATSTGNPPQGNQLDGIDLLANGLFVFPVRGARLALIDPKSPGEPKIVEVRGAVAGMPVCGIPTVCRDLVSFASRRDGKVVTLDLSAPENPFVVRDRCYDLSQGNCDRIAFHNGKMIIPAGHYGLFMEK
jgi:hypothetical protein